MNVQKILTNRKLNKMCIRDRAMNDAGFDVVPMEMDLSSRVSIQNIIAEAQKYGDITMLVNAAGVSPSQAPVEAKMCIRDRVSTGRPSMP